MFKSQSIPDTWYSDKWQDAIKVKKKEQIMKMKRLEKEYSEGKKKYSGYMERSTSCVVFRSSVIGRALEKLSDK